MGSVGGQEDILEILEFVEFVLEDMRGKVKLCDWEKQVGKTILFCDDCVIMTYVNAPIHDMLIRIKNAAMARKHSIDGVVYSKFKVKVLDLLKQYKFVKTYTVEEDGAKKFLKIDLYPVENPIDDIPEIKFYSKPSRPWYVSYRDLHAVAGGKGIGIISTSKGLMATHVAKQQKLWGELIAEIY